jgi:C-terminal processing protease CtpA/Prc
MNSIAEADILILDLRSCFGIEENIVAYILSYLFDKPKPLTKTIDRNGIVQNTTSTITISELRKRTKLYGGQKPIYVLTSQMTMWQAELLAYSLQAYQRAVIVGEELPTAGWAIPRETMVELCEDVFGKGWWTMSVQTLRTVHLATGSDWPEGGVKSDVVVEENGDARLAAIEFEMRRIEREKVLEKQDELK